jgi:DNA repair exonuclease SbcCD ATPase subunit
MTRAKAAPQPASEDASLSRPSSEEREIIGDGGDLPDVPGEIVDGFAPMPEAPAGFPALLSYFFRALNAKADRIIGVRRLENESKLWEVRAQHLRAVLGYRALQAGFAQGPAAGLKPKADEFAGRIRDLAQKLLAASGEKGQQIKALESAEVQLVAQRKKQEEDLKTLTRQLEDIDVERKQLNKEVDAAQKQGKAPPQMVFDRLQMTQGPYDELKRGVVQAQQSLAASDAGIEKNRKDRKKIAQELEALQRTSTATINATRAEFARHLAPVGEEALNAQHALSGPFRERLAEIDAGISARRTRAARYREESESVDKAKFQQGALGVGGAFVVLLVLLVVLRFI